MRWMHIRTWELFTSLLKSVTLLNAPILSITLLLSLYLSMSQNNSCFWVPSNSISHTSPPAPQQQHEEAWASPQPSNFLLQELATSSPAYHPKASIQLRKWVEKKGKKSEKFATTVAKHLQLFCVFCVLLFCFWVFWFFFFPPSLGL